MDTHASQFLKRFKVGVTLWLEYAYHWHHKEYANR